jgi:hypothetical protein
MLSKGDETSWTIMFDRLRSEENAQEKNKLLYGLGEIIHTTLLFDFNLFQLYCLSICYV